jgi:hypothetical protein
MNIWKRIIEMIINNNYHTKKIEYFKINDFEDYDRWISPLWSDPDIFNIN